MPALDELMQAVGGQDPPPAMGGPQPPAGMPYPMGIKGGNGQLLAALAGIGFMSAISEIRKYEKAKNSVGMRLDKATMVPPGQPNLGPADLQARAAGMAAQPSPTMMGGPPGDAGAGPPAGIGALLAQLAGRGMA